MNLKFWTKTGVIFAGILGGIYLLFLTLPLLFNFVIDKYTPQIAGEINKATGLSAGIEEIRIVTTPKLTAGIKVKKFELYTPQKEPVIVTDDFQITMSLLPIFAKEIRVDVIKFKNADITLKIDKEGNLDVMKYFPQQEETDTQEDSPQEPFELPFGLKLSNHMPNIHINGYKLNITDGKDDYIVRGGKTDITDFVLNKSIKITGAGNFSLKNREQFKYDIKLFNKIMPDIDLNNLVFSADEEKPKKNQEAVNIIEILRGLYDYNVTADASVDLKTSPENINGSVKLDNVSIINLTPSNAVLNFKGSTIDVNSNIYTAKNEVSNLNGKITTGKKSYLDMNFKSDIELANVLNIVKKVALIFNIKDLQTLSANGKLNADFNLKSDTKTVSSSGFLKVPNANVYYGLYQVGIDNINADVSLDNNNVNIKNIGFTILGQPLNLSGTVTHDAVSDLHLKANKLNLKGLLIAVGQAALMKENPVYSGEISMDAYIKGPLDKINPVIKLNIANVDIKNLPSDIRLKAPSTTVDITSDGKTFGGNALSTNVSLINPVVKASIPSLRANIKENEIEITQTPVGIEKINITAYGKITDYLSEKIGLDFVTKGDIKSVLQGDMNVAKQTLNLNYSTTDLSTIIIPMFDKSKMTFTGKINIGGNMTNPIISGNVSIPSIIIPEVPMSMTNTQLKLHGTILHGSGTVQNFESGGIRAENLSGDFELKGNDFYLNSLKGTAFDGKVNGNIVYNLSNAKTKVDFKGEGLNAEKAIEGAAGIKKALTGTLGFNTNLTLTVLDYNDMIKSMKGNLSFDIKKGAFGSIGKFEGLLSASNLLNNYLLKNTVASISNATGLSQTGQFDTLDGKMTFTDGWANLNPIRSVGKSLCYYITGKFNLLNGSTNVIVLGRLDAPMVAKLGPIGELSATKVLGYIPKFGDSTAKIFNIITSNPAGEKTELIPALSNGSTNYKDFKVTFNGSIESPSSIKSFKWLSQPDLSELEPKSVKETIQDIKSSFGTDIKTNVEKYNNAVETQKQMIKDVKDEFKTTADDFKNLFKSIKESTSGSVKQNSSTNTAAPTSAPAETSTQPTPAATQTTITTPEPAVKEPVSDTSSTAGE